MQPVSHAFSYRLFMLYLDLDELDQVFHGRWFWSTQRPAWARFRREDYLGPKEQPLGEAVRDLVEQQSGVRPTGPVRLLTNPRYAGFRMNPVSFYYCHDAEGDLNCVVAEVTNTPWDERHCYLIPWKDSSEQSASCVVRYEHAKQFHVSPFFEMDYRYRWRLGQPRERLGVRIENWRHGEPEFAATLQLHRRPMTTGNLARALVRFPLMTVQVFAGIYWQALRLRFKGIPFVPHPESQSLTAH